METLGVLVVGEPPSLGRSIADLLQSRIIRTEHAPESRQVDSPSYTVARFAVVVDACNQSYCTTALRWLVGELPTSALVVVGSRDPTVDRIPRIHCVTLPLRTAVLWELIRGLTHGAGRTPTPSP
jgi:hypothetical protein